jgi:peptidyl-tRNA hydrolase
VLSRFSPEELPVVQAATDRAVYAVEMWIGEGVERVMNAFNRPEELGH